MEKLTKRQDEILNYVKETIAKKGYPPTIREIGDAIGLSSPATIHVHLINLENKGYIKKNESKNRALEVLVENEYLNNNPDVVKVPLLGKVTAGSPIEAIQRPNEFMALPINLLSDKKEVFTLEVSGNSMINVGIFDGDYAIIERCDTARNGEIVVAMNENNEVTLKTLYKEVDHIRLQPENDNMEPIILDNVTILGKAIGLYRKF